VHFRFVMPSDLPFQPGHTRVRDDEFSRSPGGLVALLCLAIASLAGCGGRAILPHNGDVDLAVTGQSVTKVRTAASLHFSRGVGGE
jgi:hypothetical protein